MEWCFVVFIKRGDVIKEVLGDEVDGACGFSICGVDM